MAALNADRAACARLSARGLRSRFGGPFDFEPAAGECVAIQGPSGAGKSVLLRMLADLDPHEGEVLLDGRASSAMAAPAWPWCARWHAGRACCCSTSRPPPSTPIP